MKDDHIRAILTKFLNAPEYENFMRQSPGYLNNEQKYIDFRQYVIGLGQRQC